MYITNINIPETTQRIYMSKPIGSAKKKQVHGSLEDRMATCRFKLKATSANTNSCVPARTLTVSNVTTLTIAPHCLRHTANKKMQWWIAKPSPDQELAVESHAVARPCDPSSRPVTYIHNRVYAHATNNAAVDLTQHGNTSQDPLST